MAGIYLHIPFCRQACHYCDFHFSTSLKNKEELVHSLVKEIELQKEFFGDEKASALKTIYFGGGTPSLLSNEEVGQLISAITKTFAVDSDAEVTMEANPDDLTSGKLKELKSAGINRLSIGIQSFDDADLKWMNRLHNAEQAIRSVKDAQGEGFDNITIDLIYGTPLLSDEQWKKNLQTAFDLGVQHLSCYALTVEPRTSLAHDIMNGKQKGVDDAKQARHFEMLMDFAEANGFEQYEISNFARNGKYSQHNSSYWTGEKYLGIGPSAHSYNEKERWWNVRNNGEYIRQINSGNIPAEKEILTPENKFNEYVMTSLRTTWGCNIEKIRKEFGAERAEIFFRQAMLKIGEGLMDQRRQNFILTRKGKFFADRIAAEMFVG